MTVTLALAGDTMLGRGVAERLTADPAHALVSDEVAELTRAADLFVANLECCVSERGERWPDPAKPFFFRAPPAAAERLAALGVDAVTLANNHALDYGATALRDTLEHLDAVGIEHVGAGLDRDSARRPVSLSAGGLRLGLVGVSDHPADYAADDGPGVAYADLRAGTPDWLTRTVGGVADDVTVVTPHWGPNMVDEPVPHVRRTAPALLEAGATLVAGHSAHVFQGVARDGHRAVCFDLGDFVDDYAVHPDLRNDLGLLWLVEIGPGRVAGIEAVPLALDFAHTRVARGKEAAWIRARLAERCAALGTGMDERDGRLVIA